MRLQIALARVRPNADPELILRRIANTVSQELGRYPEVGDYSHAAGVACWVQVARFIAKRVLDRGTMALDDYILLYGSEIDMFPGECAHACIYSSSGIKRADRLHGQPEAVRVNGVLKQCYVIPDNEQPQAEKRPVDNYQLLRSITIDAFFDRYFISRPDRK